MDTGTRKILLFSLSATILIMAIVYYSFFTGHKAVERYLPLVNAAIDIKLEATTAHLYFEEVINGDRFVNIKDVWTHIDKSEWHAQKMLDEGVEDKGIFRTLNNSNLRPKIETIIKDIHHFRQIGKTRWASQSILGVTSDKDQQFDSAFIKLNLSADNIQVALHKAIVEDLKGIKFTQQLLIFLIILLGIVTATLLLRYNTRRLKNIDKLKESEAVFRQSENQLLNVINGAKLGYWDWDYNSGKIIVNDEWLLMLGLSRKDFSNDFTAWKKRLHPNDVKFMQNTIRSHLQSGKDFVTEFRAKHENGSWVWIQGSGAVVEYDKDTHKPLRLCGTHQDITERKLAELRDKAHSNVLKLLTSGESLSVILKAIVQGVEQENPAMLCSLLLLDDTGKHLLEGAAASLPDFYNEAIKNVEIGVGFGSCGTAAFINERVIVENIKTHPNCESYKKLAKKSALNACFSEPICSTTGKVLGVFSIYHRDTHQPTVANLNLIEQTAYLASIAIEQEQSQLALKDNESRFHQLLQFIPSVSVQGYDFEGKTSYWNKGSENLYGYSADEAIGQSMFDLIIPKKMHLDVQSAMQNMLKTEIPIPSGELTLMTKYGTEVNVFSSHAYIHVPGQPPEMFCIDVDLTERKKSEEKIKLAANVFSHARESIIISDPTGTIIDVNNTFITITGYSREEVIGKNSRLLQSGRQSDKFYVDMWQALLQEGYWYGELWNRRKNGEVYAEMKAISAVRDEEGVTTHYVALGSDITPMKVHQDQLERIAHYDILTNLPNRSLLSDRLSQAMLQCKRHAQSLAVIFLDLDGFKDVNDAFGHDMGDQLLVEISVRMKKALREGDNLARIGGDEFVAVLADLGSVEDCEPILERLLLAASEPISINETVLNISASIGVTLYPQDNVDADQLMRHADQAMYIAKESGKNRYHLFDTAQDDAVKVQRESLEAIRYALDNEQFVLYYQPKVNMKTGKVSGVEALIRWQHPERGLLSPIDFLPVIENNSMMIEMGEWVIDTALSQISQWQKKGVNHTVNISVNIAAVHLQQPDFTQKLITLLTAHPDVNPCFLELEVLETSALDDVQHISIIMNACMTLGVNFALDDFGTGYSSLTYLRRLPANIIKIDQTFVRDMLVDADDLAIVEGVIALAKSFKRDVIAEGVETIEHGTALLRLGCEFAQGYGIAKPMPASDIPVWIKDWKPDISWQI